MSKPVILCVDDEKVILDSLKIQIKQVFDNQYLYEAAESADEAIEIIAELQSEDTPILVIVSDWLIPGIKGDEFLMQVHQKFPNIVKIMLTGQADMEAVDKARQFANLYVCLPKPWNANELIEKIQSGIAKL
jgi:CheY-like chemotaxis protein